MASEQYQELWRNTWDSSIHSLPEQVSRLCAAQKLSKSKIKILSDGGEVIAYGSAAEPYTVKLTNCSCFDFSVKKRPCKHIYRLALEMGLIDSIPVYDKNAASNYDFQAEINRFYLLYTNGIITGEQYGQIGKLLSNNL